MHVRVHILTCGYIILLFLNLIVIFAVDVRVSFDSYRNCMIATCNQKSIITTNPGMDATRTLYVYVINKNGYVSAIYTCTCMYYDKGHSYTSITITTEKVTL